jgi:hypothetical protein
MAMVDSQLARLAKPFPSALVHSNPSGQGRGDYVSHSVVNEKLLAVVGPVSYEVVEVLRGRVKGKDELGDVVVGCLARLTITFDDGRVASVVEVGDCENPTNWPHDGARMKDASSDAFKRCAMRLGVGLHLWSQDEFSLYEQLMKQPPKEAA